MHIYMSQRTSKLPMLGNYLPPTLHSLLIFLIRGRANVRTAASVTANAPGSPSFLGPSLPGGHEIPVAMPTPKEQIVFLLILSGQGQLHAFRGL